MTPASTRLGRATLVKPVLLACLVLVGASYTTYKTRLGDWVWLWRTAPLSDLRAESGAAYSAATGRPDLGPIDRPSPAQVTEDGLILFPSNASEASIREEGRGGFRFVGDRVLFAATDNSDPRTNGREYAMYYPLVGRATARLVYGATAAGLAVCALLMFLVFRREGGEALVAEAGIPALYARLLGLERAIARIASAIVADRRRRDSALRGLAALSVLAIVLVVIADATYLTRTGHWLRFWREAPVTGITAGEGFAYIGQTGRPDIGSENTPSPAGLYEDGVQIGLRNARRAEIRNEGLGRYLFWRDQVVFATTDNSDPRANGRHYTYRYPPVTREQSRIVYSVTALVLLALLLDLGFLLRGGLLGSFSPSTYAWLQRHAITTLIGLSTVSMVLIALVRTSETLSPLVPDLWWLVAIVNVVTAIALRVRYGRALPRAVTVGFVVALVGGYYFLTVWAPQRSQGCHTSVPTSPWTLICTSGDSGSYYYGYAPGSTRQPLYPWLIRAIVGPGFVPSEYAKTAIPGTPKTDPNDAMMPVVRTQIVLMLSAAVLACVALMAWLGTVLPAVFFLWLYDQLFFTATELNIVLTEPLVQAMGLGALAAFFLFMLRPSAKSMLLGAVFAGLAYMTRQAAAYYALVVVTMALVGLTIQWRRWLWPVAASFAVLLTLILVPDFYALAVTGSLAKQQDSLQYQYRIAHAMQYATLDDLELMPDAESRAWLADAVPRRDAEHRAVDKMLSQRYDRMVYYINYNLYNVATPIGSVPRSPEFFMGVATPILKRHFLEYLSYSFEFWRFGLSLPGLARLGFFGFSAWWTYALLGVLIAWLRDRHALAAATLILCHWGGVALSCLFAAPLSRMVWASENLVLFAGLVLVCAGAERIAGWRVCAAALAWLRVLVGSPTVKPVAAA